MSGKFLYFSEGNTDGASTDIFLYPVEAFRGIDVATGDLLMYFKAMEGNATHDVVTLDVADTNQDAVIKAIMKTISTMNAGVLKVCDADNSVFLHEKITGCTNTLQA